VIQDDVMDVFTHSRHCTMFCVGNGTVCDIDAFKEGHRHLPSIGSIF
jgi:hypothetical protein